MVDEVKLVENKQPKSKIIAKKDLYMMGRKGGLRVEVREKLDGNRFLRISRWSEKDSQHLIIIQEKH